MNTKDFGPPLWTSMFMIAMNYPIKINKAKKEDKLISKRYKKFFMSFRQMLPCKHCRESYCTLTRHLPIDEYLASRRDLVYWLYSIKDLVNKKLKAQQFIKEGKSIPHNIVTSPPFQEVYNYYNSFRVKKKKN